jgi:hypothetical protein
MKLFSPGIEVRVIDDEWIVTIKFGNYALECFVRGEISNKYCENLIDACRQVINFANEMGVELESNFDEPYKLLVMELDQNTYEVWEIIHATSKTLGFKVQIGLTE